MMPTTFGFTHLIETEAVQHHIRFLCSLLCFLKQSVVRFPAAFVAAAQFYGLKTFLFFDQLFQCFQFCGVHHGGTGALIAGLKGEITDHGDTCSFLQRKNTVLVFQKYHAVCSCLPGQCMMPFHVKFLWRVFCGIYGGKHGVQHFIYARIQIRFGKCAVLDRFDQFPG